MDTNIVILSASCVFFTLLSAFFSASETALFSIPRERIDAFGKQAAYSRRLIYSLLADGQRTLLLLLLCNLFVNITLTGLIDSLMAAIIGKSATFWSFLAATVAIITFGEVLPKNVALRWNEAIAEIASPVLHGLKALTGPLLNVIQGASRFFLRLFAVHLRRPGPFITIDELKSAVRSSYERGAISKFERGVVVGLLDRGAQPAARFMTHRSQVPFVPHYATAADALSELVRRRQSCALVTRDARGHQIMGVAHISDLLRAPPTERCRRLAKPPRWAPSTMEAADLASFMFAEKLSAVCVLDEFGGLSGVFSLSDGLNMMMNVRQERAAGAGGEAGGGAGGAKILSGLDEIDGIAEWLPESLLRAAQNVRTLNGLLTRYLGRIPKSGERFDIDGRNFYIIHSGANRIESVLVKKQGGLPAVSSVKTAPP